MEGRLTVTIDDEEKERKPPSLPDAFGEVFFVCVIGILPLGLFGLGSLDVSAPWTEAISSIFDPIAKGQLFLYTFSLFGSLGWMLLNQARMYTKFWLGVYALAVIGPAVVAVYFYGQSPSMDERRNAVLIGVSIAAYWVYIAIYFRLLTHIPERISSFGKRTVEIAKETADKSKKYIG